MPARESLRMRLVGGQRRIADGDLEGVLDFYGGLFGRMAREVKHTGDLTRYVGYQSRVGGQDHLHFLGIEVTQIQDIPAGMVAWDLTDSTWTVWQGKDGQDVLLAQQRLQWLWLDASHPGCGRCTGEFIARPPVQPGDGESSDVRAFWVSANAYVRPHAREVSNDSVHLADYDPSWPQQYQGMADWLREHLGPDVALRVEHYGSTAIPGIPAKPIIDVLVEIPSFREAKQRVLPLLNRETWEYWWYSGHMVFIVRAKLMGRRTHHVHMAPRGHRLWEGLAFRDYLRTHPQEAARYAAFKRELAAVYGEDRERYTDAKTAFVQEVTSRALQRSSPSALSP